MKKKKEKIGFREGNISLILDSYEDIFSDFDPRPYSDRSLSEDFLAECERAAREKEAGIELRFLVPKSKRKLVDEAKIKKRLKSHFNKHFHIKAKEIRKIKNEGWLWFAIGMIVMFCATFLYNLEGFFFAFLFILAEPAGWFLAWEGLDKVLMESREKRPKYEFYKKMSSVKIEFLNY